MPRVIHFEIHVDDPERARAFYERVFGWQFTPFGPDYQVIKTGPDDQPGINGGMLRRRTPIDGTAVICYVCTIDVPNLDASLATVFDSGGTEALPRMPVPGIGWLAYCKDPEGNIFGMMQADPSAS